MQALPAPTDSFSTRKTKILSQLSVPTGEYADASPKGSVDEGIRDLIDEINAVSGVVTTSTCAGRVSVFLEGRRTLDAEEGREVATPGGKGAGGTWLFVSHDPVPDGDESWIASLEFGDLNEAGHVMPGGTEQRLIHFKFEPMILHVLTTSPAHAQLLIRCAVPAGFRESGAINITPAPTTADAATPMVGIRSMGLGFQSLIGYEAAGRRHCMVTPEYLRALIGIANDRFAENAKRIERFREALRHVLRGGPARKSDDGGDWEDAAARRERKRAEGLMRKAELEKREKETSIPADVGSSA